MTVDTVFDLASLTKPIATATSIIQLSRRGKLRFEDPVIKHPLAFAGDSEPIPLAQLLLHTSRLTASHPAPDPSRGGRGPPATRACASPLMARRIPRRKFRQ